MEDTLLPVLMASSFYKYLDKLLVVVVIATDGRLAEVGVQPEHATRGEVPKTILKFFT